MSKVKAPWTNEQVDALNHWQHRGDVHEFTCANAACHGGILIANSEGWYCPDCTYNQDWAHDFMFLAPEDRELNYSDIPPLGEEFWKNAKRREK